MDLFSCGMGFSLSLNLEQEPMQGKPHTLLKCVHYGCYLHYGNSYDGVVYIELDQPVN